MNRPLLLLALAALLPACGGSGSPHGLSKAAYEQKMAAIERPLQITIIKGQLALEEVRSPHGARAKVRALHADVVAGANRLAAIEAPADVSTLHAQLVKGYRDFARELRKLTPSPKAKTTDTVRVQSGKLTRTPAFKEVADALQAIIAKGYDLGLGQTSSS